VLSRGKIPKRKDEIKNPEQEQLKMKISRRQTIMATGAAAGCSLIPGSVLGANGKVNIAAIGIGGRGNSVLKSIDQTGLVNIVALCDVALGSRQTAQSEKLFPQATKFNDFRVMFDEMANGIDAVLVCVPDHTHFPISMMAMALGKHVYVEKPMARTFQEVELMMAAAEKQGVVTQMGNQGHSGNNYYQFKAWKEAGIIKDVTHVGHTCRCLHEQRAPLACLGRCAGISGGGDVAQRSRLGRLAGRHARIS
jgi:hypothetical protein